MSFESGYNLSLSSIEQLGFEYELNSMVDFFKNVQTNYAANNKKEGLAENESQKKISKFATQLLETYTDQSIKNGFSGNVKAYIQNANFGTSFCKLDFTDPDSVSFLEENLKEVTRRFGKGTESSALYGFLKTYL